MIVCVSYIPQFKKEIEKTRQSAAQHNSPQCAASITVQQTAYKPAVQRHTPASPISKLTKLCEMALKRKENASPERVRMALYREHRRQKERQAQLMRKTVSAMDLEEFSQKRERFCLSCETGWTRNRKGGWKRCHSCCFVAVQDRKRLPSPQSDERFQERLAKKIRVQEEKERERAKRERKAYKEWENAREREKKREKAEQRAKKRGRERDIERAWEDHRCYCQSCVERENPYGSEGRRDEICYCCNTCQ